MNEHFPEPAMSADPLTRLCDFYQQLDIGLLPQLSRIYHPQIVFIDPVAQYHGVDELERYFAQLLKRVKHCRFEIEPPLIQGEQASLFWRMEFAHPALKKGQILFLNGTTHVRIAENRILYQRDYYDLGAMLYEHLPLLGGAIRTMKARLK